MTTTVESVGDLATLLPDFERHLRASNKADRTVKIYGDSGRRLIAFLTANGMPTAADRVNREHLEAHFTSDQLARFKPATASQRYRALAQLWLTEEGEIRANPFARMKPPECPRRRCRCSPTTPSASSSAPVRALTSSTAGIPP